MQLASFPGLPTVYFLIRS